jgi:hypothetical protein
MRISLTRKAIVSLLTALLSFGSVIAQMACPDLVQEALLAVDGNCGELGRNEACYGYNQVEASFLVSVADNYFTQPSNIAPIADLRTIRTVPMNTDLGLWGVAVLNLQADLPNTIPGQNVTFVLLGDVELENAVVPEEAFMPAEGIAVTVNIAAGANLRSGPGTTYNVVGGLMDGQSVLADGFSEDRLWLRVAYNERPAWLSTTVIDANPELESLPSLRADLYTPMQAFYLRTGVGVPSCSSVDNLLLVQGPENIEISINVNGAQVRLGSSGALQLMERDGRSYLKLVVFDGHFELGGQVVTRGQQSIICLGDEDSRGLDGQSNDRLVSCSASEPETIDPAEFGEAWCMLEDLPANILNYQIEILCPGETLPTTGGASRSQIAGVDCSSFSFLTTTIPATNFLLSWSPATGADSYEVAVYDDTGYQTSVHSGITETSIGLNGGDGFASVGYIDLRAYRGGQYACYVRLNYVRSGDPNAQIVGSGNIGGSSGGSNLNATLGCIKRRDWEATITYTGGNGEAITASVTLAYRGNPASDSRSSDNGTFFFSDKRGVTNIILSSSSGETINLGSCP